MVRKGGLEPPRPCGRSHLKAVRLPISPLPLGTTYFFAGAGRGTTVGTGAGFAPGTTGAAVCFPVFRLRIELLVPLDRVATIERLMDVIINKTAEIVVALESRVVEPRGPKAVCEPCPPNAPARSAAFPLCSNTTMIRNRHTITCRVVRRIIPITTT